MARRKRNGEAKRARKNRSGTPVKSAARARRVKSLQKYLKAYGHGSEGRAARMQFAKRAGTKLPYLVHLAYGFRTASPVLALEIERASHGLVPREDLRPDVDWRAFAPVGQEQRAPAAAH